MKPVTDRPTRSVRIIAAILIGGIAAWLLASLFFVNIELGDGYSTIVNSLHFTGQPGYYAWNRGPLMGLILAPVAFIAQYLGCHPMDVWPYHTVIIALDLIYVIASWRVLVNHFGCNTSTLLAYVAAIPTVVFFSYAPFISHDIFPGILALWMLKSSNDFMISPRWRSWIILVLLGTIVASIKQTYALVWAIILIGNSLVVMLERPRGHYRNRLAALALGAGISALVTWISYSLFLEPAFPSSSLVTRPINHILSIARFFQDAHSPEKLFYQYVYFRNLSAYGIFAMCMVIPGICLCLRLNDRLLRLLAICWVGLALMILLIGMKEVRYLAFLAPTTAFIIYPAIRAMTQKRMIYYALFFSILLVDIVGAGFEAVRIFSPFYREGVMQLLRALPQKQDLRGRIFMINVISIVSPDKMAFFGDRYHRITHIDNAHLQQLYGYKKNSVVDLPQMLDITSENVSTTDYIIFSNRVAAREPPISDENSTTLHFNFFQFVASPQSVLFERKADRYVPAVGRPHGSNSVIIRTPLGSGGPIMSAGELSLADITLLTGNTVPPNQVELMTLKLHSVCTVTGCGEL